MIDVDRLRRLIGGAADEDYIAVQAGQLWEIADELAAGNRARTELAGRRQIDRVAREWER